MKNSGSRKFETGVTMISSPVEQFRRDPERAASEWLQKAWAGAKRRGLDTMALDEINAEIDAHRREKESAIREEK